MTTPLIILIVLVVAAVVIGPHIYERLRWRPFRRYYKKQGYVLRMNYPWKIRWFHRSCEAMGVHANARPIVIDINPKRTCPDEAFWFLRTWLGG